jgi:hypothetical protein
MPDLGDFIRDRLARMPLVVWLCTLGGVALGVVVGALLLSGAGHVVVSNARLVLPGLACIGFVVGVVAGTVLHTIFQRSRARKGGKRRPPREDEARRLQ